MQTLLSRFCQEFVATIRPLLDPLGKSADAVASANGGEARRKTHDELLDLRHQIGLLADKVAEQQAYVLIFGPLKSGKSTLMNAISASYVSEVTSLPAYPYMVYVSHSAETVFQATRYDGTTQSFDDLNELQDHVDGAHEQLALRIRESEAAGNTFDPIDNYRDAIRRIDVRSPIDVLAPSKAVLVDTPGLYTRMKFGYDRMTRDFQNAAACAVFVVRSDNLFLDQVFAEFTKLLELFSRIFLVVNIDSNKQDLGPDGKLVPSLEQSDPSRIIEAFENLTMSAPLKEAAEAGKLRIYPIDLLQAATGRLADGESGAPEFDRFFGDLTEYLDSTDYLVAFLGDSLRRASSLLGEVDQLCKSPEIESLEVTLDSLQRELVTSETRLQATERLGGLDWGKGFDGLRKDTMKSLAGAVADIDDKTSRALADRIAGWFRTDESFDELVGKGLVTILEEHQSRVATALGKEVSERLVESQAGIRITEEVATMLTDVGIDLAALGREAHTKTDRKSLADRPATPVAPEHVTVRKTIWDRLMFRSQAAVRRRLFGSGEKRKLAPEVKAQRLGEGGKKELADRVARYRTAFFQKSREQAHARFLDGYTRLVRRGLDAALAAKRTGLTEQVQRLEAECARAMQVLDPIKELAGTADGARDQVANLSDHYGQMDLFMLTKPVEPEYTLPASKPEERGAEPAPPQSRAAEQRITKKED